MREHLSGYRGSIEVQNKDIPLNIEDVPSAYIDFFGEMARDSALIANKQDIPNKEEILPIYTHYMALKLA